MYSIVIIVYIDASIVIAIVRVARSNCRCFSFVLHIFSLRTYNLYLRTIGLFIYIFGFCCSNYEVNYNLTYVCMNKTFWYLKELFQLKEIEEWFVSNRLYTWTNRNNTCHSHKIYHWINYTSVIFLFIAFYIELNGKSKIFTQLWYQISSGKFPFLLIF